MVFGLNGSRHKLLDDPADDKVERNSPVLKESGVYSYKQNKEQRISASREGKAGTGWTFLGRSKEETIKKETNNSNINSLQANGLYVTQNAVRVKKPLYIVDSVLVPRLSPGEKIPYLLPPRGDDASTESNDDVSFRLPDLDCTTDCTTADIQTSTFPSPDKSSLETFESNPEDIENPLNVSMISPAANFNFEVMKPSSPMTMDHPMSLSSHSTSIQARRDSLENSEILIQLAISQVNSDLSDPNTNSSAEASTSDSADDSSEGASGKLESRRSSHGNIVMPTFSITGLKHESIPILSLGPLSTEEVVEEPIQKMTKDAIIDGAMRMNMFHGDEREGGDVVLESLHSSTDDTFWTTTIPFKSCKSGYVSVVDPMVHIANEDQETPNIIMKRFLQAGRIIQALNYTLSLLNSISVHNSKDICMILRNASTLQMMLGRFNDSSDLLRQVSLYDQEESQSFQSVCYE